MSASQRDAGLVACLARLAEVRTDEESWRKLYLLLRPYVYAICFRRLGARLGLADDACQDTFLRLARHCPWAELEGARGLRAYAAQAARSAAVEQFRAEERQPRERGAAGTQPPEEPAPGAALAVREEEAAMLRLLGAIDRRVLRMLLDGRAAGEIADAMGLSRNAVHQRVHRIRDRLRKWRTRRDLPLAEDARQDRTPGPVHHGG